MPKASSKKKQTKKPSTSKKKVSSQRVIKASSDYNLSEHLKHTLITAFLLVFIYPVGLLVMFIWTKWPLWFKWVIAIPMAVFFTFVILPVVVLVLIGAHKSREYNEWQNRQPKPTPIVIQSPAPSPTLMPQAKKMKY